MLVEEAATSQHRHGPHSANVQERLYSPRVEPAHMVVALQSSVHDGLVSLLPDAFPCNLMVDPIGETPHALVDLAKLDRGTGVIPDCLFEFLVEVAIVQEDIGVVPPSVEMSLNGLERLDDALEFLISREDNERGVCPRTAGVDVEASGSKDLVVFFADFSV